MRALGAPISDALLKGARIIVKGARIFGAHANALVTLCAHSTVLCAMQCNEPNLPNYHCSYQLEYLDICVLNLVDPLSDERMSDIGRVTCAIYYMITYNVIHVYKTDRKLTCVTLSIFVP